MTKSKTTLTRLIIRFPDPLYKALKAEAEATSVPMAILVRQLVADWARAKAPSKKGATTQHQYQPPGHRSPSCWEVDGPQLGSPCSVRPGWCQRPSCPDHRLPRSRPGRCRSRLARRA